MEEDDWQAHSRTRRARTSLAFMMAASSSLLSVQSSEIYDSIIYYINNYITQLLVLKITANIKFPSYSKQHSFILLFVGRAVDVT